MIYYLVYWFIYQYQHKIPMSIQKYLNLRMKDTSETYKDAYCKYCHTFFDYSHKREKHEQHCKEKNNKDKIGWQKLYCNFCGSFFNTEQKCNSHKTCCKGK